MVCVAVVIISSDAVAEVPQQCAAQLARYEWYKARGTPAEMANEQQRLRICLSDAEMGIDTSASKPTPPIKDSGIMSPWQVEIDQAARAKAALEAAAEQERMAMEAERQFKWVEQHERDIAKRLKQPKWTSPIITALICRENLRDMFARDAIKDEFELIRAGAGADLRLIADNKQAIREALLEIRRLRIVLKLYKAKDVGCRSKVVDELIFCLPDTTRTFPPELAKGDCSARAVSERVDLASYMEDELQTGGT